MLDDTPDYKLDPLAVRENFEHLLRIANTHEKCIAQITHSIEGILQLTSILVEELGLQKYPIREKLTKQINELQEQLDGMTSYTASIGQEIHEHLDKKKHKVNVDELSTIYSKE